MPKPRSAAERIIRARRLIEQARRLPLPPGLGRNDLSYIAQVRDLLRQARDLIKFLPQTAGVSEEIKQEVKKIYAEIEAADRALTSAPRAPQPNESYPDK